MNKKYLIVGLLFWMSLIACNNEKYALKIPAKQQLEVDYPYYEMYSAKILNTSTAAIEVKVLSKKTGDFVRGFGLKGLGSEKVMVEKENHLSFTNSSENRAKIKLNIQELTQEIPVKKNVYRSFTLENKTNKSIPLIIPNVMNPNLSPNSKSGVELKMGQEILFKAKGKKYVLFQVDDSIQKGEVIDVAAILQERKSALDL